MDNEDAAPPPAHVENVESRVELLTAIKLSARAIGAAQHDSNTYKNSHSALLALAQAWEALQPHSNKR